ncbi:MAG: ribose 5-phosphate isomerase B [Spirochaetaceae bacterium]|jgi:ribose 5-phosphate isomerase B|nr:ribose 5-phosphate isomerase B [Spirochaetaceae bacterium]
MKIAVASDHGGFALKQELAAFLRAKNLDIIDYGCNSPESCDYAVYGYKAAQAVAQGICDGGILVCGTGAGISLAANKVTGIRCTLCGDPATAHLTKQHNNANMIALGGRIVGGELAKMIVEAWLSAEFEGGRHQRRVGQISQIEAGIFQP